MIVALLALLALALHGFTFVAAQGSPLDVNSYAPECHYHFGLTMLACGTTDPDIVVPMTEAIERIAGPTHGPVLLGGMLRQIQDGPEAWTIGLVQDNTEQVTFTNQVMNPETVLHAAWVQATGTGDDNPLNYSMLVNTMIALVPPNGLSPANEFQYRVGVMGERLFDLVDSPIATGSTTYFSNRMLHFLVGRLQLRPPGFEDQMRHLNEYFVEAVAGRLAARQARDNTGFNTRHDNGYNPHNDYTNRLDSRKIGRASCRERVY
jgi:hypothetical protein